MIKELKFAFQCMKFAYRIKLYFLLSGLFIFFGVINFFSDQRINYIICGYMLTTAPILMGQLFQITNMSTLVSSSPKKKRMQIRILTILNGACVLVGFALFTAAILIFYALGRCSIGDIGFLYAVSGVFDLIILIYMALCYKYYIASTIAFLLSFGVVYVGSMALIRKPATSSISILSGIGIGVGSILLGCVVFYHISKHVYKKPMDKRAMHSSLRVEL